MRSMKINEPSDTLRGFVFRAKAVTLADCAMCSFRRSLTVPEHRCDHCTAVSERRSRCAQRRYSTKHCAADDRPPRMNDIEIVQGMHDIETTLSGDDLLQGQHLDASLILIVTMTRQVMMHLPCQPPSKTLLLSIRSCHSTTFIHLLGLTQERSTASLPRPSTKTEPRRPHAIVTTSADISLVLRVPDRQSVITALVVITPLTPEVASPHISSGAFYCAQISFARTS
jgi:hypothetical protein